MWVDDEGVFHTVALPDPAELMSDQFRVTFHRLVDQAPGEVDELIETEQDHFFDAHDDWSVDVENEALHEGQAPPAGILNASVGTLDDLKDMIRSVSPRWRLDVLMALEDVVS